MVALYDYDADKPQSTETLKSTSFGDKINKIQKYI